MGFLDLPQGTDCIKKIGITTKVGMGFGLVGSPFYQLVDNPKNGLEALQKAARHSILTASMGAVFGLTTCMSADIRDTPHDPLNFFIGGCASGAVLGVRFHSVATGTSSCLALGTVAYFTKALRGQVRLSGPPEL